MKRLTLKELLSRKEGFTPSLREIKAEVEAAAEQMRQMAEPNQDFNEAF